MLGVALREAALTVWPELHGTGWHARQAVAVTELRHDVYTVRLWKQSMLYLIADEDQWAATLMWSVSSSEVKVGADMSTADGIDEHVIVAARLFTAFLENVSYAHPGYRAERILHAGGLAELIARRMHIAR